MSYKKYSEAQDAPMKSRSDDKSKSAPAATQPVTQPGKTPCMAALGPNAPAANQPGKKAAGIATVAKPRTHPSANNPMASSEQRPLNTRMRSYLEQAARRRVPITYQELANSLHLSPPNTIHQVTAALECLMEEDADAGRPLISALAIRTAEGELPAPGFFECARRVGRYSGTEYGTGIWAYHTSALNAAISYWGDSGRNQRIVVRSQKFVPIA